MISLLILTLATGLGAEFVHADQPFVAARNISARLEAQGNVVGGCRQVTIFMATRRALDGDHEYLGVTGLMSSGLPFQLAEEFGQSIGYMPRVRRLADGTFAVYTYRRYPVEMDVWALRRDIVRLVVDAQGVIVDLISSEGEHHCAGVAAEYGESKVVPAPAAPTDFQKEAQTKPPTNPSTEADPKPPGDAPDVDGPRTGLWM